MLKKTLRQEEEQFSTTLAQGLKLFEQVMRELKDNIIPVILFLNCMIPTASLLI